MMNIESRSNVLKDTSSSPGHHIYGAHKGSGQCLPQVTQPGTAVNFFSFSAKVPHFLWYNVNFNCVHTFICLCSQQYNLYCRTIICQHQFYFCETSINVEFYRNELDKPHILLQLKQCFSNLFDRHSWQEILFALHPRAHTHTEVCN